MPIAVNIADNTNRYDVKSAPPDGYVVIKRYDYGDSLTRQKMGTKVSFGGSSKDSFSGELDIDQEAIALWEFAHCVVEHNMQDKEGNLLNFKNPVDVKKLTTAVGTEIGNYIDEWNNFQEDPEVKN